MIEVILRDGTNIGKKTRKCDNCREDIKPDDHYYALTDRLNIVKRLCHECGTKVAVKEAL